MTVTVKQLAENIGISVEKLLEQFKNSGLSIIDPEQNVSDNEKRQLLTYLQSKTTVLKQAESQRKVTLKSRSVSTIKLNQDLASRKTVQIEVRKKRVFAKPQEELEEPPEAQQSITAVDLPIEEIIAEAPESKDVKKEESMKEKREEFEKTPPQDSEDKKKKKTISKLKIKKAELSVEDDLLEEELMDMPSDVILQTEKLVKTHKKRIKHFSEGSHIGSTFKTHGDGLKAGMQLKSQSAAVKEIGIPEIIVVSDLAKKMAVKVAEVIKIMLKMGFTVTANQTIDAETAQLVVEEMGHKPIIIKDKFDTIGNFVANKSSYELKTRPPVVTVMGHVDHGKTTLLDYIRDTKVADSEAGGITQHIGAYHVQTNKGVITFIDTPGHAAFTSIRARGAKITDLVILVVAADDGVRPQTIEAIQHAKAANVPIIVAVNKIDKAQVDLDRLSNELSTHGVISEAWGGDTIFVQISAKYGTNVDTLLDTILLQAEMLELKTTHEGPGAGVVLESFLDKGKGPIVTVLVQSGLLKKGDMVVAGLYFGRVRAMFDENGKPITEAGPSIPVEVVGISGVCHAGDEVIVVADEKNAREVSLFRQAKHKNIMQSKTTKKVSLEDLFAESQSGTTKQYLNIIIKADAQGSLEALCHALQNLSIQNVEVKIIASGVGEITESDVNLAVTSQAILMGFNVRANTTAKKLVETEGIKLYYYSVIYDVVDEINKAISGLLQPEYREKIVGTAEVRDVFKSPKFGAIAGCMVVEGLVKRNNPIRVLRDNIVIYDGVLESLRRFKDDVSEVRQGIECGIGVKNYNDVKPGDKIEVYEKVVVTKD